MQIYQCIRFNATVWCSLCKESQFKRSVFTFLVPFSNSSHKKGAWHGKGRRLSISDILKVLLYVCKWSGTTGCMPERHRNVCVCVWKCVGLRSLSSPSLPPRCHVCGPCRSLWNGSGGCRGSTMRDVLNSLSWPILPRLASSLMDSSCRTFLSSPAGFTPCSRPTLFGTLCKWIYIQTIMRTRYSQFSFQSF